MAVLCRTRCNILPEEQHPFRQTPIPAGDSTPQLWHEFCCNRLITLNKQAINKGSKGMSTLVPVGYEAPALQTSRTEPASTSATDNKTATNSEPAGSQENNRSNIELSTRAQKIQKLNEEFFSGGPQSLKITPAFIERLKEYGFLSAEEASKLSPTSVSDNEELTGTLGELTDFIDRFNSQLKDVDSNDSLIITLQKAKSIINNFDGSTPSTMATDIKTVTAELSQYRNSEAAGSLSEEDQKSLKQLELTLKIADKLNPENLSSQKVNHYLSVLGQSF